MGVTASNVPLEVGFDAPEHVRDALAAIGRTEDVRFAPSGRRLAIACLVGQGIALADVAITVGESGPEIAVTSLDLLDSTTLSDPHGIDFVDDDTLVVANRGGGVAVLRLPSSGGGEVTAYPVDGEVEGMFQAPGSVAVRSLGQGHHELLVCNNSANTVTRHLIDGTGALVRGEIVLRRWLDIPDGITAQPRRALAGREQPRNAHRLPLRARPRSARTPTRSASSAASATRTGFDSPPTTATSWSPTPARRTCTCSSPPAAIGRASAIPPPRSRSWTTTRSYEGGTTHRRAGRRGSTSIPARVCSSPTSECQPLAFFDLGVGARGRSPAAQDDALVRYEIGVLAEAESVKAAAAAEATALQAEIASIRATAAAEASALQTGIEMLQAELERVNGEYERFHAAATESNTRLAAANDHLTQVHRSKSWRLTAPMRGAVRRRATPQTALAPLLARLSALRLHVVDVAAYVRDWLAIGIAERLLHPRHVLLRPGREVVVDRA